LGNGKFENQIFGKFLRVSAFWLHRIKEGQGEVREEEAKMGSKGALSYHMNKLFVTNLPVGVTEAELINTFEIFGKVIDVHVSRKGEKVEKGEMGEKGSNTGMDSCFAFVRLDTHASAAKVCLSAPYHTPSNLPLYNALLMSRSRDERKDEWVSEWVSEWVRVEGGKQGKRFLCWRKQELDGKTYYTSFNLLLYTALHKSSQTHKPTHS
jgi:RNA recognition motif-containing protein